MTLLDKLTQYTSNFHHNIDWYSATCVKYVPQFDDTGRLLNSDPNVWKGELQYKGNTYEVMKRGWITKIFLNDDLLYEIDNTPEHLKNENK